jgi:hypothetical protein
MSTPHQSEMSPPAAAATGASKQPDEFDPASIRLRDNVAANIEVRTETITVPVRKPSKQSFARVYPNEGFAEWFGVIQLDGDDETYLVPPALQGALAAEMKVVRLYTAIDTQNNVFLWPVPQPNPERPSDWHLSHHEIAQRARTVWVRMRSNKALGAYVAQIPEGSLPEPKWPEDLSYADLLRKAFKDRVIKDLEHPVVKRLQGRSQ